MKNKFIILLLIFIAILNTGCNQNTENVSSKSGELSVSVSFHAMEELVKVVGLDKVHVSTIVPTGMEPHDFEPKALDITNLTKADVFVYNGLGMEPWAEKAIKSAENDSLTTVVASDNVELISISEQDPNHEHESNEQDAHEHSGYDPHVWLSITGAITEVQNIADGLSKADPDNQSFYQNNAKAYIGELEEVFKEYKQKFDLVQNKNFVTGHAAFSYFCRDFGLEQNSVEDVFAGGEPGTKQLADLVDYCKENNVTTIFSEATVSTEVSKTLANEIGGQVVAIHTMENPEDGLSYLDRMKENCEKVYSSLAK